MRTLETWHAWEFVHSLGGTTHRLSWYFVIAREDSTENLSYGTSLAENKACQTLTSYPYFTIRQQSDHLEPL